MPKSESKETEVFTKDERSKLQNYLQNNLTESNLGIFLTMYSGLRFGEFCALTWNDIDHCQRHSGSFVYFGYSETKQTLWRLLYFIGN